MLRFFSASTQFMSSGESASMLGWQTIFSYKTNWAKFHGIPHAIMSAFSLHQDATISVYRLIKLRLHYAVSEIRNDGLFFRVINAFIGYRDPLVKVVWE